MSEPQLPRPNRTLSQLFDLPADKGAKSDTGVDHAQSAANIKAAKRAALDTEVDMMLNETLGIIDEVHAQIKPPF